MKLHDTFLSNGQPLISSSKEEFFQYIMENIDEIVADKSNASSNQGFIATRIKTLGDAERCPSADIMDELFARIRTAPMNDSTLQNIEAFTLAMLAPYEIFTNPIKRRECTNIRRKEAARSADDSIIPSAPPAHLEWFQTTSATMPSEPHQKVKSEAFDLQVLQNTVDEQLEFVRNHSNTEDYLLAIGIIGSLVTLKLWHSLAQVTQNQVTDIVTPFLEALEQRTTNSDVCDAIKGFNFCRKAKVASLAAYEEGYGPFDFSSEASAGAASLLLIKTSWDYFQEGQRKQEQISRDNLIALEESLIKQIKKLNSIAGSIYTFGFGRQAPDLNMRQDTLKKIFYDTLQRCINLHKDDSSIRFWELVLYVDRALRSVHMKIHPGVKEIEDLVTQDEFTELTRMLCENSKGGITGVFDAIGTALGIPDFGSRIQTETEVSSNLGKALGRKK